LDKNQEKINIHWLFIQSQERKEKGQEERKIEVNEHKHTLHSFFFLFPTDARIYTKVVHMNMSPSCIIKPKQSVYQPKSKLKNFSKNKQSNEHILKSKLSLHIIFVLESQIEGSMTTTDTKQESDKNIYIELDLKCR
jgi:hypothetical protein